MSEREEPRYILGVDFGSTTLSVKIYDQNADLIAASTVKVPYVHPEPGAVEINPDAIWDLFIDAVNATFTKSEIPASKIEAFGFSCQRGTIVLWDKQTGEVCSNFISWQDRRCSKEVINYNKAWLLKTTNVLGSILYTFLRQAKFLVMKILKYQINQASMKLAWFLDSNPEIRQAAHDGSILFGTLDTYIIWKLTKGRLHVSDASNASGTGMFDPYILQWSAIVPLLLNAPLCMFPSLCDTSGHICDIDEDIFGAKIPLTAVVADTQAGAFGQLSFEPGETSCTIGTGCFFTINTGTYAHASIHGVFPQVGWQMKDELTYLCEGNLGGVGPSLEWAQNMGFFDDVSDTSDIAQSVEDSDGVYFVPGFFGLPAPFQDPFACAGMIGINRSTSKAQIVRAILEGIGFMFYELYRVVIDETKMPFHSNIKVSGGVTNNDFLMKLISSLTGCVIEKTQEHDVSLLGAVYLAGLGAGIWKDKKELMKLDRPRSYFRPDLEIQVKYLSLHKTWEKAAKRCTGWYDMS